MFIDLGEYRAGQNAENDFAMNARPKLTNWLKQSVNEKMPMSETLKSLNELLSKVNRLIRRTAQSLAACEASLQKLNAEKEKLVEKERLYDMQLKNLQSLLDMKELLGEVVFRQDIFYSLRKVAVIQQQIAEINLEKQKIAERRKILNKEIVQQQAQRKHWWLKGEKYDRLKKRIKKQLLNQMLYQDELEQEEKYNGRSQEN